MDTFKTVVKSEQSHPAPRSHVGQTGKKQEFARETGIPTFKAGVERKIGRMILKSLFGK